MFNHTHALAAGLARTFLFPRNTTADFFTYVSRSGHAPTPDENEAIRASVHGGAHAPCIAQNYHGMTLHDTL